MKKYILICIEVFFLCSCRSTFYVTPEDDYIEFVKQTNSEIMSRGYTPVACNCDTVLQSAYHWRGYTWPMDRIYISDYVFVDSVGDTMEYSVAVNYDCTNMGDFYVDSAAVWGCRVSKEADGDLCTGELMNRLANPPKRKVRWHTEESILGWMIGIPVSLVVSFLVLTAIDNQRVH